MINLLTDAHQHLIKNLINENVEFIIIGGYSVIFHGYIRSTGDMDLFIKPDNKNKLKLIKALKQFGINKNSLVELKLLDFTHTHIFGLGKEPERIEFLTKINLVSFEEADNEKVIAEIDGLKIPFLHLNHLILSKMNTGRPQDKADIEMLQKINKSRKNNSKQK